MFCNLTCITQLAASVRESCGAEGTLRSPLLIIGVEGFGSNLLRNIIQIDQWEEIGCLLISELSLRGTNLEYGLRKGICSIWRSKVSQHASGDASSRIILVNADQRVPHHRANAWASILLNKIAAERSLLFNRT